VTLVAALETSTARADLALLAAGGGTLTRRVEGGRERGRQLLPALEGLLEEAGHQLTDLDLLAVGVGPGSYTGVRLGIALLQGLAEALGLPLCGVDSLLVLAHSAPRAAPVLCTANAYRGEIFHALYDQEGRELRPRACDPPARALAGLPEGCTVWGDGGEAYAELVAGCGLTLQPDHRPEAVALARLAAADRSAAGDPAQVVPVHLRAVTEEFRTLASREGTA
jgi:tRNA threonylcarbamoyladenosine biosynthesis protein TsaB